MKKLFFMLLLFVTACSPNIGSKTDAIVAGPSPEPFNYALLLEPYEVPEEREIISGGDCFADRAEGDIYIIPDPYCMSVRAEIAVVAAVDVETTPTVQVTPDAPTTPEATPEPPVTPEGKPEKECKNKNALKEGTPDCNAGKGNG